MPRMTLEDLRKTLSPERFQELYSRYLAEMRPLVERTTGAILDPVAVAEDQARKLKRERENQAFKVAITNCVRGPVVREFRFHPTRRWRFDYAITDAKIAVEIEGGIFGRDKEKPCPTCHQTRKGRHNTIIGMVNDIEKYNTATALGWRVLRFTREQMKPPLLDSTLAIIELTVHFDQGNR